MENFSEEPLQDYLKQYPKFWNLEELLKAHSGEFLLYIRKILDRISEKNWQKIPEDSKDELLEKCQKNPSEISERIPDELVEKFTQKFLNNSLKNF